MGREHPQNLAILLTPPLPGAIAVVRLLGAGVDGFLRAHFSKEVKLERCVHGTLFDGDRVIDDPVVVIFPDGSGADISLHGGTWVVRSMLDLAAKNGFEIVDSSNAMDVPEMADGDSPLEREVNLALPLARAELGLRMLLSQVQAWKEFIDGTPSRDDIQKVLSDDCLKHLLHPPALAIVGAANVGKSTLANRLFGQERSITADVAGTTRDWVGETANIDGLPVMLIDTPGVRLTEDAIERAAIEPQPNALETRIWSFLCSMRRGRWSRNNCLY